MKKEIILEKIKYWWTLFYAPFYLIGFTFVEKIKPETYHMLTVKVDYSIPFCEWFIFFYYAWFGFVVLGFAYLFFNDKLNYVKMITVLFTGMTIFLVVSFIYPNVIDLRPAQLENRNVACLLCNYIWKHDTPTNVLPSIHVYNSLGLALAMCHTDMHSYDKIGCVLLAILITLSTLFVKQHSVIDGLVASIICLIMYYIVYVKNIYFFKHDFED